MVDFPEMTMKGRYWIPFLTQREVEFMVARVEKDREDVALESFRKAAACGFVEVESYRSTDPEHDGQVVVYFMLTRFLGKTLD